MKVCVISVLKIENFNFLKNNYLVLYVKRVSWRYSLSTPFNYESISGNIVVLVDPWSMTMSLTKCQF